MRIRIPWTSIDFTVASQADIDRRMTAVAADMATRRAASIVKLYARNSACVRSMIAGRTRVREERLEGLTASMIENEARGLMAFADRMSEVRSGAAP